MSQLFPVRSGGASLPVWPKTIFPYRYENAWVFDDDVVGLRKEPFVAGASEMIDRWVADLPNAGSGFALSFGPEPFPDWQAVLTWTKADPVEGNWYRNDSGEEGWLCPALFWYFATTPDKIYIRVQGIVNTKESNKGSLHVR